MHAHCRKRLQDKKRERGREKKDTNCDFFKIYFYYYFNTTIIIIIILLIKVINLSVNEGPTENWALLLLLLLLLLIIIILIIIIIIIIIIL